MSKDKIMRKRTIYSKKHEVIKDWKGIHNDEVGFEVFTAM
jgi:hypothetical protein